MGFMDSLNDLAKKAQAKIQEVATQVTAQGVGAAPVPVQDWYYTIDGKTKHGPFSLDQLKKLAEAGQLQPSHMVKQEGTTKWVAAGEVEELRTNLAPSTRKPEPVACPAPQAGPPPLPANPDEKWYYAANGQQAGPESVLQLKELIRAGQLNSNDMVWKEGMAAWAAASSISILFPRTSQAPPPFPVVAPPATSSKATANRVTGEIDLEGVVTGDDDQLDLLLDGKKIGTGSLEAGIHDVLFESTVGNHSFTLVSISKEQKETNKETYRVEFKKPGHHTLKFKPSWLSAFPSSVEKSDYSPHALEVVPMSEVRRKAFLGSWQPITNVNEWLEFTKDGAVVFSDGSAGRVTISGNQPNEVIEIEMVNGQTRQFKVVSLTSDQLVIAEGNEATTFRRPGKPAVKKREKGVAATSGVQDVATTSEVQEVAVTSDDDAESAPTSSSKSIFGGFFSFFTHWKCPKCGQRSAEKISSERVSDVQQGVQTTTDPATNQPRQMVVNFWTVRLTYCCKDCKHQWAEEKQASRIA